MVYQATIRKQSAKFLPPESTHTRTRLITTVAPLQKPRGGPEGFEKHKNGNGEFSLYF
jgi:hypothetical protein